MIVQKIVTAQGEWAKKGEDIKDGDVVTIVDEGQIISGEYGDRNVFKVETRNGKKLVSFNQTSINHLVDGFGKDTKDWIGKEASIFAIRQSVAGKLLNVFYVTPKGWVIDDAGGDLKFAPAKGKNKSNDAPLPDDEVNVENIPF